MLRHSIAKTPEEKRIRAERRRQQQSPRAYRKLYALLDEGIDATIFAGIRDRRSFDRDLAMCRRKGRPIYGVFPPNENDSMWRIIAGPTPQPEYYI